MRNNSFKTTAVTAALSAVMSISCGITAFAAPAEITDTTTAPVSSDTEITTMRRSTTTSTTSAPDVSENSDSVTSATEISESGSENEAADTAQTTAVSTAVTTTQPAETELENPFSSGMLADDDFYQSVVDYLADGVNLDLSGTAILVDESTVNEDKQTDNENSENDTADSTEKLMYTVVSRDGSTFYIIIDKGGDGENVYFLNKVDIIDLASLINTEDENLSAQEKAILNEANMSAGTEDDEENLDEDNTENSTNSGSSSSSSNTSTSTSSTAKKDDTTLYIIVAVAAVAAIGIGWYFKVGPGSKKNKASFDETEDEEDEDEEEYYDEEESEEAEDEDAPEEEAYEEE